jgi:glycosyltransferase involved in cell wall biosynthesis
MMTFAGIIVGKLRKTETVMYVLDLWPENLFSVLDIKNPFMRKLVTTISHWHYRRTDKVIALSEQMKEKLIDITGKPKDQIIVLPQACEKIYEKDGFDPTLHERFKNTFNVLYTGNISPAQSFETIIEAAAKLKQSGRNNIKWIIVGDGMSRKHIEIEVEKAGLSNNFVFEGQHPIEDIPKYNHEADVLVGCLVKSELLEATIPAKVMSYIASGKPMALAMDGEVQDLINTNIKCGYAGPTEDAIALADNITKIYEATPDARLQMGQNARDYHFKHFERNIILDRLHDFIFAKSSVE